MDQRTRYIVIGGVVLLFVAAVLVTIFYLGRIYRSNSNTTPRETGDPLSQLPVASLSVTTTPPAGVSGVAGNTKLYAGQGFSLDFPNNWSLLTCNNSQNFEFDPAGGADLKNVVCDTAVKPVTVLVVNRLNCTGETVTLGTNKVVKSKTTSGGNTNYRWCVNVGNKGLDITHRVSGSGARATSKDDFSAQIEQMIQTVKASPQAS